MNYLQYKIVNDTLYPSMKRVVPESKGSVHKSLRGMFSSVREAIKAIDSIENSRKEEESNVKRNRRSRTKPV